MKLIVGLGNPGKKYEETRHNIGFKILEKIKTDNFFPDFSSNKKFKANISKKGEIILLKPLTFMNKSGISVSGVAGYYNISPEDIIVIHDDSDFELGIVKVDKNRSSAGHNGVKSIIKQLGTKDFWRVRFGIGRKDKKAGDIALKRFSKEEIEVVNVLIKKTAKEIITGTENGFERKKIKKSLV